MSPAEIRWLADEWDGDADDCARALRVLADMYEAAREEHGKFDREPECNLCLSVARVEALRLLFGPLSPTEPKP